MKPLYDLLKLSKFTWTEQATQVCVDMKQRLTSAPILQLPDETKPLLITTDASNCAVGAMLSQMAEDGSERPVAFESKKLNDAQINYPTYEKELYAIIYALEKWGHYVRSSPFTTLIVTDHQPLKHVTSFEPASQRQCRWNAFLSSFNYEIVYRPGKSNSVADALSRRPDYRDISITAKGVKNIAKSHKSNTKTLVNDVNSDSS
jgi:hypothetical protein